MQSELRRSEQVPSYGESEAMKDSRKRSDSKSQSNPCSLGTLGTSSELQRPTALVPFDEHKAVRIYQRNLPHWRQDGCTYFVTFRLIDSIPAGVQREWEYEQAAWLNARGIQYDGRRGSWRSQLRTLPQHEQFRFEKHFNRQVQACLDRGLGECWLKEPECIEAMREQLFKADRQHHHLGDFVIMPNHVHLLTTPISGHELEMILKAIKGKAAIDCNKAVEHSGTFWQPESYDHIVRDLTQLFAYRRYIAANPDKAGLRLPDTALYRADWMDAWLKEGA
jgi:type I restriction enzyme R subunit